MRTVLKWGLRVVLALAVAAVVAGIWKRDQVKQLLAVNSLFSAEKIVNSFSSMDTLFTTVPVPRGNDAVVPLPIGAPATMPDGMAQSIVDRDVTALVVLKDGALVHEDYFLGTTPEDLRISWSVAKSFLSALMGIVLEEGDIKSIDDQVTDYVLMLIGSAYDGAMIKDVLQMSSGVVFNEDYLFLISISTRWAAFSHLVVRWINSPQVWISALLNREPFGNMCLLITMWLAW